MAKDRNSIARDRVILFKQVFTQGNGKLVLFDLLNRFHFMATKELTPFEQGQRSAAAFILRESKIKLADFDRMLSGDFSDPKENT